MKNFGYNILLIFVLLFGSFLNGVAQTVRVMPMGNSITFDSHSNDTRPDNIRISYRYKLYQLLTAADYDFDFVGSEDAGSYYLGSEMDDNAGFPGIRDDQLADLINTGYNDYSDIQVTPGPYLDYFPADIILLHIGTNDLTVSPDDVEDILDNIRSFDPDVYIIVARIINRKTYHAETTQFNNNVEAMVTTRGDNRIIMVDMEDGAGIDYSTEMVDNLHPKQSGYDKMAYVWFDALDNLNQKPVISSFPDQYTGMGKAFDAINLDTVVTDIEDPDYLMQWTYRQQSGSNLNISIDVNRILQVSPKDDEWLGSETIWLKVEDTGNGAFKKADSVEVTFTVEIINNPPIIISEAILNADDYEEYSYTIEAIDTNQGDVVSYFIHEEPEWLHFNTGSHTLSGIPQWNHANEFFDVSIGVTDGIDTVYQDYTIFVSDTDDPPEFTSTPDTIAYPDSVYMYELMFFDKDEDDELILNLLAYPNWLTYIEGSKTFYGSPSSSELNQKFPLILELTDGKTTVYQTFEIHVMSPTSFPVVNSSVLQPVVFPNPTTGQIYISFPEPVAECIISLHDIQGRLIKAMETNGKEQSVTIDLSGYKKGFYFFSVTHSNHTYTNKILIK
ncbi:MAG: T9SS type A sorting domain-containing protein [Bacteroidales bacterium]|nr:T9SS type A sorting domain-containing protein [Bacteroidales bacterium]